MVALFLAQQPGQTSYRRRAVRKARAPPRKEGFVRAKDDARQLRRRRLVVRTDDLAGGGVNRFDAHAAIVGHRARAIFPGPAVVDGKLRSAMTACLNGHGRLSILEP